MNKKELETFVNNLALISKPFKEIFYQIDYDPNTKELILQGHHDEVVPSFPEIIFEYKNENGGWYKYELKINKINIEIVAYKSIYK